MDSIDKHQRGMTKIKTVNFNYTWIIDNFSFHNKKFKQSLDSPTFCLPGKQDCKWYLALYPKGFREQFEDYMSLYLELQTEIHSSISTKTKFSILDSNNIERNAKSFRFVYEKVVGSGSFKFIKHSTLINSKNELLPNDKLTIICRVTAGLETENVYQETETVIFEENRNKFTLGSEFECLLEHKHMTDIKLIADGKEVQAHKAILAARSSVFLAMLKTEMQEKQTSQIEFHDVSIDVLQEMLQYLYTGTVKNIKEYAYDLVILADKYDIKGLKLMCEEWFYNELSINSAVNTFILANRYNCDILRPLILKFIVTHAKDILKTVEFKRLEKDVPILIREMMHAMV